MVKRNVEIIEEPKPWMYTVAIMGIALGAGTIVSSPSGRAINTRKLI